MTLVPRIVESLDKLQKSRRTDLIEVFSSIAYRKKNINVMNLSTRGDLIFGVSDVWQSGQNFKDWRFLTISQDITASYHEVWMNHGKGKYFLERSYFHLYTVVEEEVREKEYLLLHCDASEPANSLHSIYKQSPHIHVKCAEDPIPKAHFALYNGRLSEVLKNRASYTSALIESVDMLNSQVLQLHPLR